MFQGEKATTYLETKSNLFLFLNILPIFLVFSVYIKNCIFLKHNLSFDFPFTGYSIDMRMKMHMAKSKKNFNNPLFFRFQEGFIAIFRAVKMPKKVKLHLLKKNWSDILVQNPIDNLIILSSEVHKLKVWWP